MNNLFFVFNNFCSLDESINHEIKSICNNKEFDVLNFDSENVISKDKIIEIQNLLNTKKQKPIFLIIKNFEILNKEINNSLLLFLEEKHTDVYCIFCSAYEDKILKTILSRCIKKELIFDEKKLNFILEKYQINNKVYKIFFANHFYDENEIKMFIDNNYEMFNNLNSLITNNDVLKFIDIFNFFKNNKIKIIKLFLYYWLYFFQVNKKYILEEKILLLLDYVNESSNKTLIFNEFLGIIYENNNSASNC